jgi:Family of unknown function (DUF6011)
MTVTDQTPRCRHCGKPLSSQISTALTVGPICFRRLQPGDRGRLLAAAHAAIEAVPVQSLIDVQSAA